MGGGGSVSAPSISNVANKRVEKELDTQNSMLDQQRLLYGFASLFGDAASDEMGRELELREAQNRAETIDRLRRLKTGRRSLLWNEQQGVM